MINLPPHLPEARIGLFGGSFNPAHEGHKQVALYALHLLQLDYVWWLVAPQNPLKDSSETEAYALRLAQTAQIADHPQFAVSDVEQQIGAYYTAHTLAALKEASAARFVWIMGADSLADIHRWRDWEKIFNTVPLAILVRPGYSDAALQSPAALRFADQRVAADQAASLADMPPPAWAFLNMPLRHESSTAIRARRKTV